MAYSANSGLCATTIKTYLTAICHLIICHDRCPPSWSDMPKLKLLVGGVQKVLAFSTPHLPITSLIHRQIRELWS